MKSVADDLRLRARRDVASMSPAERVQLALALGDDGVESFAAAQGLGRDEAVRRLRRQRQQGRRPSGCLALPVE